MRWAEGTRWKGPRSPRPVPGASAGAPLFAQWKWEARACRTFRKGNDSSPEARSLSRTRTGDVRERGTCRALPGLYPEGTGHCPGTPRPRAHRSLGGAGGRSPCPVQAGPRPPKGHACSADGRTLPRSSSSLCRSSAERNFEVLCTPVPGRSLRSRRLESQAEEGSRGTARGPAGHHLPL